MLVRVYTVQNATLLEITCCGSNFNECTSQLDVLSCSILNEETRRQHFKETAHC